MAQPKFFKWKVTFGRLAQVVLLRPTQTLGVKPRDILDKWTELMD